MADKTFGVKVSDETYEKAKMVIESSGMSSKEWFDKALALYEVNAIKQGSSDYTSDLTELEHHTTRIYELIVNMMQRSVYLKDHAVKEVADKLESKESLLGELQEKLKEYKESVNQLTNINQVLEEEKDAIAKQLDELKNTIDTSNLLISEYKDKNDTLTGLVAKYQGYVNENERLKHDLEDTKENLTKQAVEAEQREDLLKRDLSAKEEELQKAKQQYDNELQMAMERKDLECEKVLVDLERKHQSEVAALNTKYNDQLLESYNEIADLRKVNEQIKDKMQSEIDLLKNKENRGK